MFKRRKLSRFFLIIFFIWGHACIFPADVGSESLILANPGFETGDFTGWETYNAVSGWYGGSAPFIGVHGHPQNMYYAGTFQGYWPFGTGGLAGFRQSGISMPSANEVVWSFWVNPSFSLDSRDNWLNAYISIMDADNIAPTIKWHISGQVSSSGTSIIHFADTLPTGWTMVPAPSYSAGYMVTTNNLKDAFPTASALKIDFAGAVAGYGSVFNLLVDDKAPIPEPSTFLLFVAGLAGAAMLGRKKLFGKA